MLEHCLFYLKMCYFKGGFIILYLFIHTAILAAVAKISNINNNNNNKISIWPLPYDIKLTSKKDFVYDGNDIIITIGKDFFFNDLTYHDSVSSNDNLITRAIQRYENLIHTKDLKNYGTLKSCDIIINDSDYNVDSLSSSVIGADESYSLVLTETAECSITG